MVHKFTFIKSQHHTGWQCFLRSLLNVNKHMLVRHLDDNDSCSYPYQVIMMTDSENLIYIWNIYIQNENIKILSKVKYLNNKKLWFLFWSLYKILRKMFSLYIAKTILSICCENFFFLYILIWVMYSFKFFTWLII